MTAKEQKAKRAAYMRQWNAAHPGYSYKYSKVRRAKNPNLRKEEYARSDKGKHANVAREWRKANLERLREYDRQRYASNPERKASILKWTKERRKRNPDCRRASERAYRERNKGKIATYNRKYSKQHPDVSRQNNHRRRAQKYTAPFEQFRSREIYERDGWICGICSGPVEREVKHPDPMSASLDHIVPLARGGNHTRANCQCAHLSCNKRKNAFGIAA